MTTPLNRGVLIGERTQTKGEDHACVRCRGERCNRASSHPPADRCRARCDRHPQLAVERRAAADPGREAVKLDLLDARAVREVVLENEPEAIVHQATALANVKFGRNMDKVTAKTSELRTKGTDALLAAAREAGVRRFVAQSVAAFSRYAREGGPIKTEDDPLDPTPPKNFHQSAAAMAYLEQAVTDFGGIALRYGAFYGAANDGTIEPVRKRQFPIVGDGGGIWSWIHLDDAAAATVLALERSPAACSRTRCSTPCGRRTWPGWRDGGCGRATCASPPAGSRSRSCRWSR